MLRGGRIVDATGERVADVLVEGDRITEVGGRLTASGAVLDLAPSPWNADLTALKARQSEVTKAFEPAGVMCDLAEETPGTRWIPVPLGD